MTHLKLAINNTTIMDGDLGTWSTEPPAVTDLKLKAGKEPWAIPALQAIATAAITQQNTTITITTSNNRWSMDVNHDT